MNNNLKLYFDKLYYINLDEDTRKKHYFNEQIASSNLLQKYMVRYDAVIGKYLDIRLVPDSVVTREARDEVINKKQKQYGVSLTYGSLACALSHYLIYQECASSLKPFLVVEDDIVIDATFDEKLLRIMQHVAKSKVKYDILYLGYNDIPGFKKKILNDVLSQPKGLITGLYSYIISPIGAQKMLDFVFPLRYQIDSEISHNEERLKLLCATNPIADVRTDFGSKTQNDSSCQNVYPIKSNIITNNWMKLFS